MSAHAEAEAEALRANRKSALDIPQRYGMNHQTMDPQRPNNKSPIPDAIKQAVKRDFVLGKGAIRELAKAYSLSKQTISAWIDTEKWTITKAAFSAHDDLIEAKKQIEHLDKLILTEKDSESVYRLVKSKESLLNIVWTLTGIARRPIGKLEKPKSNELFRRLEQAARNQEELEKSKVIEPEPSCGHDTTTGSMPANCGVAETTQDQNKALNIEDSK
jgi:uncharacterized protein YjcR